MSPLGRACPAAFKREDLGVGVFAIKITRIQNSAGSNHTSIHSDQRIKTEDRNYSV